MDNVSLVDEQLLQKVNDIVVEAGMQLIKKKQNEALRLKTDSYALETNIHFPTDLNLLWDSSRKMLDTVLNLRQYTVIEGWRKIKAFRTIFITFSRSHAKRTEYFRNRRNVFMYNTSIMAMYEYPRKI